MMQKSKQQLICIIGGSNSFGKYISKLLLMYTNANISILDQNQPNFEFYKEYQERIEFKKTNFMREEIIHNFIKEADLVINVSFPFFRFGYSIAKTIINAGICGLDICNDYSVTTNIITLDELARKKGVTYVTGVSFSPGISNLFVMKAVLDMEKIDDIKINLAYPLNANLGKYLIEHFMYLSLNKVPILKNGKINLVSTFSDESICNFPLPIGTSNVSIIGGSEVMTLSEYLEVQNIHIKGVVLPHFLEKMIKFSSIWSIQNDLSRKKLVSFINSFSQYLSHSSDVASIIVKAQGIKKMNYVETTVSATDSLENLESYLPVVTSIMMLNEDLKHKGVYSPEGCLDERKVLNYISQMGLVYYFSEKFLNV